MNPIVKKFNDYVNSQQTDHPVPDFELKAVGWTDAEIEELKEEFRKNNPKKLYKDGECYQCGSQVDCTESHFDNQTFRCDCGVTLTGKESENQVVSFCMN